MRLPADYGWMLLFSWLFGLANAISHGRWQPIAFLVLTATLGLMVWRFGLVRKHSDPAAERTIDPSKRLLGALFALLVAQPIIVLIDPKVISQNWENAIVLRVVEVLTLLLVLSYAPFTFGGRTEPSWVRRGRFAAFAVLLLVVGGAAIRLNPSPGIDVWTLQMKGVEVLLEGKNPYVFATVPDTDPENDFTNPFNYPPTALYSGLIGFFLGKDVRYATVLTVLIGGLAIRFIARRGTEGQRLPSILADAPTLLYWLTPFMATILELAWIDPIQIMLISCGVAAFVAEKKTLCAIVFGIAISSKQSMFWVFPLACAVLGLDWRRWAIMLVAAVVPELPFMIWDFKALKAANMDFVLGLPPRKDALCFTNALWQWFHVRYPHSTALPIAGIVVAVACMRHWARSELDFARALVLTYFVFFFFNRWAFANYYFLLTGLSSLAAAAAVRYRGSLSSVSPRAPVRA